MQNGFEFDKSPNSTESTWSPENNYEHQKGMKNLRNTGKLEGDNTLWQVRRTNSGIYAEETDGYL